MINLLDITKAYKLDNAAGRCDILISNICLISLNQFEIWFSPCKASIEMRSWFSKNLWVNNFSYSGNLTPDNCKQSNHRVRCKVTQC